MVTNPTVPLALSELVYVSMSVIVQEIEKNTDYPCAALHLVLQRYSSERDQYLRAEGFTDRDIAEATAGVIDGLYQWLEERADQNSDAQEHLALWERELNDPA